MRKFNFTLEKVKNIKETLFEIEKGELAKLRAEKNVLEKRLKKLENDLAQKEISFQQDILLGVGVDRIRQFQYMKSSLENQMKTLKMEIWRQDNLIEKQLLKVIEADREVKVLSKLKENQFEEYQYAENKEQQEFILELVSNKLSKNPKK